MTFYPLLCTLVPLPSTVVDEFVLCIPGKFLAMSLKSYWMFKFAWAEVSMNRISGQPWVANSLARFCPSSVLTSRFCSKSSLLPTSTIWMSSPLWFLASPTHFWTLSNDAYAREKWSVLVKTYTLCRSKPPLRSSLECTGVSSSETSPIPRCPTPKFGPFYRPQRCFWSKSLYPRLPIKD